MIRSNYIVVRDVKDKILDQGIWKSSLDYGLFHITPERPMAHRNLFRNCTFFDLYIDDKTDWGAPIPSTFQAFFPDLMKFFIHEGNTLFLNVIDVYGACFEEEKFVRDFLRPRGFQHFFIDKQVDGQSHPSLFFECPIDQVQILNNIAFDELDVDIDGFVLPSERVESFRRLPEQGNTDVMFRDMLREVYIAFGIWADQNGLFVTTDKFDIPSLQKSLRDSSLQDEIANYIVRRSSK